MPNETSPKPQAHEHETAPEQAAISPRVAILSIVVFVLLAGVLAGIGILSRMHNDRVLAQTTTQLAAPTVIALPPKPGAPITSFVLPGNVTAYTDAPIYARTSGYLTRWYYDIGARVKKGALLAEIATPELDQQLRQAEADLATAQATANNARIQADRYTDLVKTEAVSQQDTDTFVNQAASTAAAVRSAQANVQRLRELQSFEKIYAPFDGIVTARNIDTGQLVDQGAARELFHMQALQTVRVYTNVPQLYTPAAKIGTKFDVTFPEFPSRTFQGTLVRTSQAIDPVSRTLLVEIDINNRDGQILPGSLAQVHFKTPVVNPTFIIPVSALIFRTQGLQVATVVDDNRAHLIPITIGQDDGATAQVITGLTATDRVIQDPPDSIIEGEKVSPQASQPGENAGGR
jgi:RND family efflux transporter MFP subunit